MRVFISSTSYDLKEYRKAVIGTLQHAGENPLCMEHEGAVDTKPIEGILRMVRESDVYVGIFARRYGFCPKGRKRSMTHIEYEEAKGLNKPRFIFLLTEDANWPLEYEDTGEPANRLKRLRKNLESERWCELFTPSPDKLANSVLAAIHRKYRPPDPKVLGALLNPSPDDIRRTELEFDEFCKYPPRPTSGVPLSRNFKDRETELAHLHQCIRDTSIRAVIVCGRAGTGKTQLVAKWIQEVQETAGQSVADIPWVEAIAFVSLGDPDARSPEVIVEMVSRELGAGPGKQVHDSWQAEGVPLRERIRRLLADTLAKYRCIIVLDNLESVLDQGNRIKDQYAGLRLFIEELLLNDHKALLIATTRRELAMSSNELEARVIGCKRVMSLDRGLPVPDAIALLRESDPSGSLGIKHAGEEALKKLVEQCGRVPRTLLSIVGTISSRQETFDDLVTDEEAMGEIVENPERELYASLQTSEEQYAVQAIAVFQQFEESVPSVAVNHMLPSPGICDVLHRLVLNRVVSFSPVSRRYSLHPAFLQYAYEQIGRGAEASHQSRMHELAAGFYEKLHGEKSEWRSIRDLEPHLREIRHLIRAGRCDKACGLLNTFDREYLALWRYSGLVIELRELMRNKITDPYLAALNLGNLGVAFFERGNATDWEKTRELYAEVIPQFHELGKHAVEARAQEGRFIGNKGVLMDRLGKAREGEELLSQALGIANEVHDRTHQCRWLGWLAELRYRYGWVSIDEAACDLEDSIRIAVSIVPPDRRFEKIWSRTLGRMLSNSKPDQAANWLTRAATVAQGIGDLRDECLIRLELRLLHSKIGQPEKAGECLDIVKARVLEVHKLDDARDILLWIGNVYGEKGSKEQQIDYYEQALKKAEEAEDLAGSSEIYTKLAGLYLNAGMPGKVTAICMRFAEAAREAGNRVKMATAAMLRGEVMVTLNKIREAISSYEEAFQIAQEIQESSIQRDAAYKLAVALRSDNDAGRALQFYAIALPFVEELGNLHGQVLIHNEMGICHYNLRRFKDAITCYKKSLDCATTAADASGMAIAQFNIGDSYLIDGNPAGAILYYEKTLNAEDLDFRHKIAEGLGIAHIIMSQQEKARHYFEMCIALCDDKGYVANTLAPLVATKNLAWLVLGETEKGLEGYRAGLADLNTPELVKYALDGLYLLQRAPSKIRGLADAIRLLEKRLRETKVPS